MTENFTLTYENGGFGILNLHSNSFLHQQRSQQLKNNLCLCDKKECEVLLVLIKHYLHQTNNLLEILKEFIEHFKESRI